MRRKNKSIFVCLTMSLLLLTGCSSENVEQTGPIRKEIQISAQVGQLTRTTYEHIFTNAACWVWADNVDEDNGTMLEEGTDYLRAWQLTAQRNGMLTPASDDKKLWPENGNLNFYVLVGNAGNSFVKNETAFPSEALTHAISDDQRTEAVYNATDLMYGSLAGVTSDDYPMLQLKHMLSQVQVALIAGGDITKEQLATAKVELANMPTTATITMSKSAAPVIAEGNSTGDILINTEANGDGDTYQYAKAIVAPHSHSGHFVKLTYDSQTYYYDLTRNFESGHSYVFELILKDGCIIALNDAELPEWSNGGYMFMSPGSCSLSVNELSLHEKGAKTVTITENISGGDVSVVSDNADVAIASIDGETITVTGVSAGTANITVTSDFTNEYVSASQTIVVTVASLPSIPSLSDVKTMISNDEDCSYFLGHYVDGEGKLHETRDANTVGIVSCLCNSSRDADLNYAGSRIMVFALEDANTACVYGTKNEKIGNTITANGNVNMTSSANYNGYANTSAMVNTDAEKYQAAYAAWTYQSKSGNSVVNGSSGWFLPSYAQMNAQINGLGSVAGKNATLMEKRLAFKGKTGMEEGYYWLSTVFGTRAWVTVVTATNLYVNDPGTYNTLEKENRVRTMFVF